MAFERVSTLGLFQTTMGNFSKVTSQLANLQNQLSSGYKSQYFEGISANAAQFMQLEDQLARMDQYLNGNNLIRTRIDTTSTILTQTVDTMAEVKNLIILRRNDSLESSQSFDTLLDAAWQTLVGQMNTNVNGRYLFSGGRTDTPPMNKDNFPTLPEDGVPNATYYAGDSRDLTVRASDTIEIVYNVRANADGFKKIFGAMALAKEGAALDDDDMLEQAFQMASDGIEDIISMQSVVNSNIVTLENTNQDIVSLQIYWQGVKEEISNTDIISASTQVAINQAILQASFQSFARITSLRLSDFLR